MSDLFLNLDELSVRHEQSENNRKQLYDEILKACHNKITKYNKEFKKQECLYTPPHFVIGKPPYDYTDLVIYIIESLKKNGLRVEWLPQKQAIYLSWKPIDINRPQYQSQFATTVYNDDYSGQVQVQVKTMKMMSSEKSNTTATSKKKKINKEKPILQHVAMVEYNNKAKDIIPINIKGLINQGNHPSKKR